MVIELFSSCGRAFLRLLGLKSGHSFEHELVRCKFFLHSEKLDALDVGGSDFRWAFGFFLGRLWWYRGSLLASPAKFRSVGGRGGLRHVGIIAVVLRGLILV